MDRIKPKASSNENIPRAFGLNLHTRISTDAQQYLDGGTPVHEIHTSLGEYVHDNRASATQERDAAFWELQTMRIQREALAGALARAVCNKVAGRALEFAKSERLDAYRMLGNMPPHRAFTQGVSNFLTQEVGSTLTEFNDKAHPNNSLLTFFRQLDHEYLEKVQAKDRTKRLGAMATGVYGDASLTAMFAGNYQHDAAPLMITSSIAVQDIFGELPGPHELMTTTLDAHQHWLAVATHSRLAWGSLLHGPKRYRRILNEVEFGDYPPSWANLWPEGFERAGDGVDQPFDKCPTESPLLHCAPGQTIITPAKNPQRCCGQLALVSTTEENARLSELAYLTGSPLAEKGAYSPAEFLFMLGRSALVNVYNDPVSRRALENAKTARDAAMID